MESYHIVLLSVPALSHVRPLMSLATRLVLERDDIVLTIFLSADTLDKGVADVQYLYDQPALANAAKRMRQAHPLNIHINNLLTAHRHPPRILATFVPASTDTLLTSMAKSGETYTSYYTQLTAGQPVTCASTGTVFPGVPPPAAVIMDFIAVREVQATRAVSGASVPIIAMNFTPAAPFIRLFGPEGMGGLGDLGARVDGEVERTGRDAAEVGAEIYYRAVGEVLNIPGLPAMYDYEAFPQQTAKGPMAMFLRAGYASIMQSDGLILTSCKAYETSGSLDALKAYRAETNKPTFALGPLVPVHYTTGNTAIDSRGGDPEDALKAFLNDKLAKFGENSVLFMSFGTMNWPESLDNVEEVLGCLIEREVPFIFSYPAPAARLPEALIAKVNASGLGYLSKWVPQHYVLTHPATGWFLTHCGWGGVVEALGAGVPMICWPFSGDQPFNAAHLSENLNVGIELIEVRTGECGASTSVDGITSSKPLHRNGRAAQGTRAAVRAEFLGVVDTVVRGERGVEMRKNVERVRREFEEAWKEGGDAREEVRAFLREFVVKE
ncbi:hypothetical protein D9619_003768 [Psilocybe cf. subviscida]|uniref:Glycosyltransferase family 1 protein n=1 Tax=Psilocybe cf. subviscida TaxID=2480587 RepID=A0A8H5AW64_9AGAR|nr:hypothetical protein D9619_003768 [Psilocybe cf. subviscida]